MKIIKALNLDKYCDPERYAQHDGFIFRDATGGVGGEMGITSGPVYLSLIHISEPTRPY